MCVSVMCVVNVPEVYNSKPEDRQRMYFELPEQSETDKTISFKQFVSSI